MRKNYLTIFIVLLTILCSCSHNEEPLPTPIKIQMTRSETEAMKAVNHFAFDLLEAAEQDFTEENPNYVFSPQTLAWSIAMIANGVQADSEAKKELTDALHLKRSADISDINDYSSKLIAAIQDDRDFSNVTICNAVFHNQELKLKENYRDILSTFFQAKEFNNNSETLIDSWISAQTNGKMTDFATRNHLGQARFGVISNLSFEGSWMEEFNVAETKDFPFKNADGSTNMVPMMTKSGLTALRGENDLCHLLSMGFRGGSYEINFMIPKEGLCITDIIDGSDAAGWEELLGSRTGIPSTTVMLPRIQTRCDINWMRLLESHLGIRKIFTDPKSLSMASEDEILISEASQSTIIDIDESGAKAASSNQISDVGISADPFHFYLNEPFIYLITETSTGAILFIGKVCQL